MPLITVASRLLKVLPMLLLNFATISFCIVLNLCYRFYYNIGERKKVLLEEQIEDIVNAVSFCYAHQVTKGHPIILMGWGMAGCMILEGRYLINLHRCV